MTRSVLINRMVCGRKDALNWLWKHLRFLKCETCIADNNVSELVEECRSLLGFNDGALKFVSDLFVEILV